MCPDKSVTHVPGCTLEGIRHSNYVAAVRAGIEFANAGNRQRALEVLNACDPGLQGWEWRYARSAAEDSPRAFLKSCLSLSVNSSGTALAYIEKDGETSSICMMSLPSCSRTKLVDLPADISDVVWADHELVFTAGDTRVSMAPASEITGDIGVAPFMLFGAVDIEDKEWIFQKSVDGPARVVSGRGLFLNWSDGLLRCHGMQDGALVWDRRVDRLRGWSILVPRDERCAVVLTERQHPPAETDQYHVDEHWLGLSMHTGELLWQINAPPLGAGEGPRFSEIVVPGNDEVAIVRYHPDVRRGSGHIGWSYVVKAMTGSFMRVQCMHDHVLPIINRTYFSHGDSLLMRWKSRRSRLTGEWFSDAYRRVYVGPWINNFIGCFVTSPDPELAGVDVPFFGMWVNSDSLDNENEWVSFSQWLRQPLGGSGLAALRESRGSGVFRPMDSVILAARPGEIFPLGPFGLSGSVSTLSMWRNQPSAIYPGGITTLDCDAAVRLPIENGPFLIDAAAASTTGSHTAIVSSTTLRVLDTTTGADHGRSIELPGKARAIALTANAQHAATLVDAADGSLLLATYSVADGAPTARVSLPAPNPADTLFVLAASANQLAVAAGSGPLRLFTLPDLRELPVPAGAAMPARAMQFAPAGDVLAIGRLDGRIDLLRRDGSLNAIPNVHLGGVAALTWSVDGSRLFTAGEDGFVRLWDPVRRVELLNLGDNSVPGQPGIRAFEGKPCCLFATPDDERLFCGYTDGAVRVWDTVPWLERVERRKGAAKAAGK